MTIWRELFGGQRSGLERVREQLLDMLTIDRQTFDIACRPLLGDTDPVVSRREASASDQQVNELVQEVRRQLVVHASARGDLNDMPALLLYMSIVKDIERIGDYAKNILDIASAGGAFATTDEDYQDLAGYRDRTSSLIEEVRSTFAAQDAATSTQLLTEWGGVSRELDQRVDMLVVTDEPGSAAVPRALYYRYLNRIIGHLLNILTALVMPLDKLDFFWQEDQDS